MIPADDTSKAVHYKDVNDSKLQVLVSEPSSLVGASYCKCIILAGLIFVVFITICRQALVVLAYVCVLYEVFKNVKFAVFFRHCERHTPQ